MDVPADKALNTLDRFLRKIWLECCGHLSEFLGAGKSSKVAYDFCLTDQGLYFINRMDPNCVYLCGKDGVGSLKISNDSACLSIMTVRKSP